MLLDLAVALEQIIDRLTQSGEVPFSLVLPQKKYSPIPLVQNSIAGKAGAKTIPRAADLHQPDLLRRLPIEDFIDDHPRLLHGASMCFDFDGGALINASYNHRRTFFGLLFHIQIESAGGVGFCVKNKT